MKVSILIPSYRSAWWIAICIHRFKKYPMPVEHEIIVCDNSPGHKSIKALTNTSLGEGVKVISGSPDFPSHGMGYDLAYEQADGDWIFTSETDSFPVKKDWFAPYAEAAKEHELIGPEMPQSAGTYIHPAGALVSRKILDTAWVWRMDRTDWLFIPSGAIKTKISDKAYHVVARREWLNGRLWDEDWKQAELWQKAGAWQEMRSFENDSFDTYPQRTGITHFTPQPGIQFHTKIGYEAGQWLSYFAAHHKFRLLKAPVQIHWMKGFEGQQADHSVIFDGFTHVWCGTVATLDNDINPFVRAFKLEQMETCIKTLPNDLVAEIKASGAL